MAQEPWLDEQQASSPQEPWLAEAQAMKRQVAPATALPDFGRPPMPSDATFVPTKQGPSYFTQPTIGASNWLPDSQLLKEGTPESSAMPNYDSPYWKLPERDQNIIRGLSLSMTNQDEWAKTIKNRYGFDPHDPKQAPFTSYGKVAGGFESLMSGITGKTTPEVEGSSSTVNTIGNLVGTGVRYGALMAPLTAAGVPELPALVGASMASAGQRQAVSDNPSQNAATEEIVTTLALGALGKLGRSLKGGESLPIESKPAEVAPKVEPAPEVSAMMDEAKQMSGVITPEGFDKSTVAPDQPISLMRPEDVPRETPDVTKPQQMSSTAEVSSQPPPEGVTPTEPTVPKTEPVGQVSETPVSRITKDEIAIVRKEMGLDELPPIKSKSWIRSAANAKEKGMIDKAVDIANDIQSGASLATDERMAAMAIKKAQLETEIESLSKSSKAATEAGDTGTAEAMSARQSALQDDYDNLTAGARTAGSQTGRTLRSVAMGISKEDFSVARVKEQVRTNQGRPLTPEQNAHYEDIVEQLRKAQEDLKVTQERLANADLERERVVAERIAERSKQRSGIETKSAEARAKVLDERTDLKKRLAAIGYRVNDVTGATAEGSYLIGRIALTYLKEGVIGLDEVVKKVLLDIPEITKEDVWRGINATDPKRVAKIRSAIEQNVAEIKSQANVLTQIQEMVDAGQFVGANAKTLKTLLRKLNQSAYKNDALDATRMSKSIDLINQIREDIRNNDTKAIATKFDALKKEMRTDESIASLTEQLKTGNYEIPEKIQKPPVPPELEQKQIVERRLKKRLRNEIEQSKPMTRGEQILDLAAISRSSITTFDVSATMRQNLFFTSAHPATAAKIFGKSLETLFSKYKAEQIENAIQNSSNKFLYDVAGIEFDALPGDLGKHTEFFSSRMAERIPGYGKIVQASSRNMTTAVNLMRKSMMDEFIAKYPNATTAELQAWGDVVMKGTGKGDLGQFAGAAKVLGATFFAPKFTFSRFQTPYTLVKYWEMPRVRAEIAKNMAATVGAGATVIGLAVMNGAKTGADPASPDFGKIVIGDTRIDLWGGFLQPARLILQIGEMGAVSATQGYAATQKKFLSPTDLASQFAAFRLNPALTIGSSVVFGKDVMGQKIEPLDATVNALMPLLFQDIRDAWELQGGAAAVGAGAGSAVGLGIATYRKKSKLSFNSPRPPRLQP